MNTPTPIYRLPDPDAAPESATPTHTKERARRRRNGRGNRYKRQLNRLRAENELLHAKLAMIYDALNLTIEDTKEDQP